MSSIGKLIEQKEICSAVPHLPEPPTERTLLLVHGFGSTSTQFSDFLTNPAITNFYNNIIAIDYYEFNNFMGNGLRKGFNNNTPIEDIGDALAQYIIAHPERFHRTIDIVAYSMGGLVVRSMIKRNYPTLVNHGYKIDDVALIATPNHGTQVTNPPFFMLILILLAGVILGLHISLDPFHHLLLIIPLILFSVAITHYLRKIAGYQGKQVASLHASKENSFLKSLNTPDETPYGIEDVGEPFQDITWSTFFGSAFHVGRFLMFLINPFRLFNSDGFVRTSSAKIEGAVNYGPYPLNHDQLLRINDPKNAKLSSDLIRELTTLRKPKK